MHKKIYFLSILLAITAILATLFLAHQRSAPAAPAQMSAVVAASTTSVVQAIHTPTQIAATTSAPTPPEQTRYTIPVSSHETVIEAMRAYASSTHFAFAGREYPGLGFFVDSIGGVINAGGTYWTLYLNGTMSPLGASSAVVSPGDAVEWRYERD